MHGQPCIRGHRFSVAHVLRLVAAGMDLEQIQEEFPFIEAEDVRQALLYGAEYLESRDTPTRHALTRSQPTPESRRHRA